MNENEWARLTLLLSVIVFVESLVLWWALLK